MLVEILLLFMAGIGAGLFTGFFGGSANLIAVPILVVLGGYSPYLAVGLGLSIDVFSSITAFFVYHKHDKVKIKPALPLILFSIIGVVIGSFVSVNIPTNYFSMIVGLGIAGVSIKFLINQKNNFSKEFKHRLLISAIWGLIVGIILGIFGGGGGVILLVALTLFLGYPIHVAIGTSVIGMVFMAFVGGASHYVNMPFPMWTLAVGAVGGIIGALYASRIANILPEKTLNKIVAASLIFLGVGLFLRGLGLF